MSNKLNKLSKSICPICKKIFEWKSGLSRHMRMAHANSKKKLYKCNICNKSFLKQSGLNIHRRLHTEIGNAIDKQEARTKKKISEMYKNVISEALYSSDSDCEYELLQTVVKVDSYRNCPYICEFCGKKFMTQNNLKHHVFKKHRNASDKEAQVESFDCAMKSSNDNAVNITKKDLIEEIGNKRLVENNERLNEDLPDMDVQEIITIKTITSHENNSDRKYYCTICNATFKKLCHLTNHRKIHLKQSVLKLYGQTYPNVPFTRKYTCQLCRRSYSQKIYLENHMRLHECGKLYEPFKIPTENMHLCTFCGKQFASSSHLSIHTKLHVDQKRHLCSTCGKSFRLETYLINHQKIHTQERLFICKYCDKRFIHKGPLVEHMRIHTGIKPHECAICNKKFTHYNGLAQHLQTHTDEKKHICSVCGKGFRFSGRYREHMRTHTGDKPYGCDVCGRKFALSGSLLKHKRTHSGERPYKCITCNKGFIRSYNLKQHLKTHTACREKIDETNGNITLKS